MIRFINTFKKKISEKNLTAPPRFESDLGTRQALVVEERLQQSNLLFSKVRKFSKRIFIKSSTVLAKTALDAIETDSQADFNGEDLEIVQSGEEEARMFKRFEDLPVEIRLAIFEFYLEEPRITTLNFRSDALVRYHCIFGRSFRLICGSLPPILCLNHEYRDTFLERFTVPGLPKSQTTLSIEDALLQADYEDPETKLADSSNGSSSNVFPVYATHTRRHVMYQPKDTLWIQGDFWLDELRRSTIARSVFFGLQHLAVQYNTRSSTLFEVNDMWDFVECMISTFPDLKTVAFVLGTGEAIAERPIYNGEINFTVPEKITVVMDLADATPPSSQGLLSNFWNRVLGKSPPAPEVRTEAHDWSPLELTYLIQRMLVCIKTRAIQLGYRFPTSGWDRPREIGDWVVPKVSIVTANLSTASKTQSTPPSVKIEHF